MKWIFWNIRGIVNNSSRLALKRLIFVNKLDMVMIVEPWVDFSSFLKRWLKNLNLKMFAMNYRQSLLPNLWCLYKVELNLIVLMRDDQHINSKLKIQFFFCFSIVYMLPPTTPLEETYGTSFLLAFLILLGVSLEISIQLLKLKNINVPILQLNLLALEPLIILLSRINMITTLAFWTSCLRTLSMSLNSRSCTCEICTKSVKISFLRVRVPALMDSPCSSLTRS